MIKRHEIDPFTIEGTFAEDVLRLVVGGELDLASAPAFAAEARRLMGARPARVIIDLSATTFLDSTGFRTLIELNAASEAPLTIIAGPGAVRRTLELVCASDVLDIVADDPAPDAGPRSPGA